MNPTQHTQDGKTPRTVGRRRFLGLTAAGALAGVATAGRGRAQSTRTIELGGKIAGWQGRNPESIAGKENPTLALEASVDYRITWTNLDGMGHNIALLDGNGEVLERTDVMSEQGATQTIEFTAREEMAEYICEPHRSSMRGSVSFGSGASATSATATKEAVPSGPTVGLERVVGGFQVPTDMALLPGDDRRVVVDLYGIAHLNEGDRLRDEPFLDLRDRLAEITGERGFLGLAPHPDYERNRRLYVRYSAPLADDAPEGFSHTEVLAEFEATADGTSARPDSERVLLEVHEPRKVHNGGAVAFGPDGYCYTSYGDGGSPRDAGPGHASDWYERNRGGNGQDVTENLRGSILRIDVDSREGEKAYGIPDDNPLVGKGGLDEHYAWGFRNPWRMGFSNGTLYAADVGQNRYEEIDRVVKGGNYGWNVREGTHCYGTESLSDMPKNCPSRTPPDVRGGEPLREPIIEYPHARNGETIGISVIGGYLYDGSIDALDGKFVFGDYSKEGAPRGSLFAATPSESGLWEFERLRIDGAEGGAVEGYLIAIARDAEGELFALTSGGELGGAVNRITATEATKTATTPTGTNATATDATAMGTDTTATARTETATPGEELAGATDTGANATASVRSAAGTRTANGSSGETMNGSGGANGTETSADGVGFGVLAALAGIGGLAARRLRR